MDIRPIKNKRQYQQYLSWVDSQFNKKVPIHSPEGDKLQVVLILIQHYENLHFQIPKPDPISAVKLIMMEKGLKSKDLVGKIGTKGHVSAILQGKKPLTLSTARILHDELGIPAEIFFN